MRLMRRVAGALFAAGLVAGLAACGGGTGDDSASAGDSVKGKSVGISFCTESHPWCAAYIEALVDGFEQEGLKTTVLTSEFNQAQDSQNVDRLVAQKVDVLVSGSTDANGGVPGVLRAKAKGVPYVNIVGALPAEADSGIAVNVLSDTEEMGRIAARLLVDGLVKAGHKSGNVLVVTGVASSGAVIGEMKGIEEVMAEHPEYKIVAVEDAQWDAAKAQQITQQLLAKYDSRGGIQGVIVSHDLMALGVIQAIKQAGVKLGADNNGIVVTGAACSAQGTAAIRTGEMFGTATQGPRDEAAVVVEATLKVLRGESQEKVLNPDLYSVTAENVDAEAQRCEY